MSTFSTFLRLCWLLCALIGPALGLNTPHLFQWKFSDETIPTNLPTCVTFGIIVESANITTNATIGVPPYYMISLPTGGTPQTQLIGSDQNNLMWTVTQPVGSQMLLSVVDSQQNPGGIPGREFTVIAGQTTQCVTTPISTPAFTVSANVTTDIETCAPWGLTVVGGTPPFTVTLAQTNVPVVTNVSMDFGTDRFTFINRAHPTGTLIAAVSDLEGRWASGTPIVHPTGSTNTDCIGLASSSGNNTLINEQDAQINAAEAAAKRKHSAITAVVVIFVLLILAGLGGAAFWQFRKRQQQAQADEKAAQPMQFIPSTENIPGSTTMETGTGRWQIGSDEKRNLRRGDIEAPPYQEIEQVSGGLVASGSGLRSGSSRPATQSQGESSTFLRSQLPKLRMPPAPPSDVPQGPRSLDSTSGLIASMAATDSPESSMKSSPGRAASVSTRFANFPTKPIRKNSGLAVEITPKVSKAPSAFPETRGPRNNISEEDASRESGQYYQDSVDGVSIQAQESSLPRYRSLTRGRV